VLDKKRFIASHPNLSAKELASMRMQLHERIAMPWACLILTLFAVPAGARTGRQGVLGTVFAAISLMVVFYATAQLGVALGATGRLHPAMAAWLANGCCSVIGLYLLASVR
jgi:lipopolysaccharide export system permease protein